jgi:hypothetical protein
MNKRIIVLAASHFPRDGDGNITATPEIIIEFAESIVKECIGVVGKRFMGDLNREDMEVRRCVEDLKKHFGVEE